MLKTLILVLSVAVYFNLISAKRAYADILEVRLRILTLSTGEKVSSLEVETEACGHAFPSVVVSAAKKIANNAAVLELKNIPACSGAKNGVLRFSVPIDPEMDQLGLNAESSQLFWQEAGKSSGAMPVMPGN